MTGERISAAIVWFFGERASQPAVAPASRPERRRLLHQGGSHGADLLVQFRQAAGLWGEGGSEREIVKRLVYDGRGGGLT